MLRDLPVACFSAGLPAAISQLPGEDTGAASPRPCFLRDGARRRDHEVRFHDLSYKLQFGRMKKKKAGNHTPRSPTEVPSLAYENSKSRKSYATMTDNSPTLDI